MAKIDVIVPAYNASQEIRSSIQSLMVQEFHDFEIIIIDDGSTDDTKKIALELTRSDSRIKILSQTNAGASSARNAGFRLGNSPYVTFMDSDDLLYPKALKSLYESIEGTENDYVVGGKNVISISGKIDRFLPNLFRRDISMMDPRVVPDLRYHIAPHAKLIRRDFLEDNSILFLEGWTYEDYLFSYELLLKAKSVGIVQETCYEYRIRENSISQNGMRPFNIRSRWEIEKKLWEICEKFDSEDRVYGDPKLMTFNTRMFRNIQNIGLGLSVVEECGFDEIKDIILDNFKDFRDNAKGFALLIYMAISRMEYKDYRVFRTAINSLKFPLRLDQGNVWVDTGFLNDLDVGLNSLCIGSYKN